MEIIKILEKKLIQESLHHLVILTSNLTSDDAYKSLIKDVTTIVQSYFFQHNVNSSFENNPDILFITAPEGKKMYDGEIVKQISRFLSHNPLSSKKFIIFDDISNLSEIHCNKLLKFLEEPPIACQYFLLNPNKVKMINTINSRSIAFGLLHIVKDKKGDSFTELFEKIKSKDLNSFCDYTKTRYEFEQKLFNSLIDEDLVEAKNIAIMDNYLKELKRDREYNNTPYMRHTLLFKLICAAA